MFIVTVGAPLDRQDGVTDRRERGQRHDDGAEADDAADGQDRQDRRIGAGVQALTQGGQVAEIEDDDQQGARCKRRRDRPDAGHGPDRGHSPFLPAQVGEVQAGDHDQ